MGIRTDDCFMGIRTDDCFRGRFVLIIVLGGIRTDDCFRGNSYWWLFLGTSEHLTHIFDSVSPMSVYIVKLTFKTPVQYH